MQARQPIHRDSLNTTGPSAVLVSAVVGHAEAQAGCAQCMQSWRPKTQSGGGPVAISLKVMGCLFLASRSTGFLYPGPAKNSVWSAGRLFHDLQAIMHARQP